MFEEEIFIRRLVDKNAELTLKNFELRKALQFYTDADMYRNVAVCAHNCHLILLDSGYTARKALYG